MKKYMAILPWISSPRSLSRRNINTTLVRSTSTYVSTLSAGSSKRASYASFIALPRIWWQMYSPKRYRRRKSNILHENWDSYRFEGECWKDRGRICGTNAIRGVCALVLWTFLIRFWTRRLLVGQPGFPGMFQATSVLLSSFLRSLQSLAFTFNDYPCNSYSQITVYVL